MIVGIPKEIKNNENRVSLTPAGAHELVQRGHTVYIQHTAGINSGFSDEEYEKVGARILPTIKDVYAIAEMIIKVKDIDKACKDLSSLIFGLNVSGLET